jgi:hypothetical protein
VRDIAEIVAKIFGAKVETFAPQVQATFNNPIKEETEEELDVTNDTFKSVVPDPVLLESEEGLLKEVRQIAEQYMDRCDKEKVISKSNLNKERVNAATVELEELWKKPTFQDNIKRTLSADMTEDEKFEEWKEKFLYNFKIF